MTTTTDPVCGKQFESSQAVAETEHDLHTSFLLL
jgi:YHS domain-containing protein